MQARKILLGVDFSPASRKALDWASALAHETGATLLIAAVEPGQPTSHFGSIYQGLADPGIAELAKRLAELCPSDAAVPCEHRILRGDAATELLNLIHDEQSDAARHGSAVLPRLAGPTVVMVLQQYRRGGFAVGQAVTKAPPAGDAFHARLGC